MTPRSPEETSILTTTVDWLTRYSRLWYDLLHEELRVSHFYPLQELKEKLGLGFEKLVLEEQDLNKRKEWRKEDIILWDKVQCLYRIMHARSLRDLRGRIKRAINNAARAYKILHPKVRI